MAPLPQHIDPWRMAAEQRSVEGEFLQSDLLRLSAIVEHPQGMVKFRLSAKQDSAGRTLLHGIASTDVVLSCQRCLQPMTVPLCSEFTLAAARTEKELEQLPQDYDPLLLGNNETVLTELIEDELLLNLPIIPKHADEHCSVSWDNAPNRSADDAVKPFANLSKLLAKRES